MLVVTELFCLGKTRGGDAGVCGEVFVLAKRVAVTQVLVVRFLSSPPPLVTHGAYSTINHASCPKPPPPNEVVLGNPPTGEELN